MTSVEKPIQLPVNVSKLIYFPLQGDDQFIRTGTIADGSCLIHSLFHAYSDEYQKMDEEKRIMLVQKFRKDLSKNLDIDEWKALNNGVIALLSFQELYMDIITTFYNFIKTNELPKKKYKRDIIENIVKTNEIKDIYECIFSVIKLEEIENFIVSIYEKNNDIDIIIDKIPKGIENMLKEKLIIAKLNKERIDYFVEKIRLLIVNLINYCINICYRSYCKELEDPEVFLGESHLQLISDKFNFDIYFINGNTRMPYLSGSTTDRFKKRTSVFILWVNEIHYEIMGRVIKDSGNKVQRKFNYNDPFVTMMYNLNVNPRKFAVKYPNFIHFLPKDLRDEFGIE